MFAMKLNVCHVSKCLQLNWMCVVCPNVGNEIECVSCVQMCAVKLMCLNECCYSSSTFWLAGQCTLIKRKYLKCNVQWNINNINLYTCSLVFQRSVVKVHICTVYCAVHSVHALQIPLQWSPVMSGELCPSSPGMYCEFRPSLTWNVVWIPSLLTWNVVWIPSLLTWNVVWIPSLLTWNVVWIPSFLTKKLNAKFRCVNYNVTTLTNLGILHTFLAWLMEYPILHKLSKTKIHEIIALCTDVVILQCRKFYKKYQKTFLRSFAINHNFQFAELTDTLLSGIHWHDSGNLSLHLNLKTRLFVLLLLLPLSDIFPFIFKHWMKPQNKIWLV